MIKEYTLWELAYSFEVFFDRPSTISEEYVLVAMSSKEARDKADQEFFKSESYKHFKPARNEVTCKVRAVKTATIAYPALTLDGDKKSFRISAKISKDKKSLEFIVSKK
ncbi:MAG: hypothetical protein ABIB71_03430 [Candidatus Woesearchaeota archaeon]